MLVLPFVSVYTNGVSDADYILPLFAVLITLAHAGHCLRLPYNLMILAGGHYKQTQSNYIIAAVSNIVISVFAVHFFGLVGVTIGTLVAMLYQTIWMARYISKNLLKWPFQKFLQQCAIDVVTFVIAFVLTMPLKLGSVTYYGWVFLAVKVAMVWLVVVLLVNIILKRDYVKKLLVSVKKRVK